MPDTSRAALEDIKPQVPHIRDAVLGALEERPMATFQLATHIGRSYRSVQPRTSELRNEGLISDSGERAQDPDTGKKAIVWKLVPQQKELFDV